VEVLTETAEVTTVPSKVQNPISPDLFSPAGGGVAFVLLKPFDVFRGPILMMMMMMMMMIYI
jgi:hypothetical protein